MTLAEAQQQIADLEARLRLAASAARMSAQTNEAVTAKLVRWAPIVDAASRLVASWMLVDSKIGARAAEDLVAAVTNSQKEPEA